MSQDKTAPIPVEITNHPQPEKYETRSSYQTAALTSATPYLQIAGPDPLRLEILFGAAKNIILCGSLQQVQDPSNLNGVTGIGATKPNGRVLISNFPWSTKGQGEVWITAATTDLPIYVGVEIVRKVKAPTS